MELSLSEPEIAVTTQTPSKRPWLYIGITLPPFLLSVTASAICYRQTSTTLGLFLGPLLLGTLFVPSIALTHDRWLARLSVLAAVIIGTAVVWLSVGSKQVEFRQVFLCTVVLGTWLSAVAGGAFILREIRIVPAMASVIAVIVSSAWLTWPVWLSPVLASHQRAVEWLCWAHPIMAMNSVVRHLGLWGSPMGGADLTYRYLTILNQDVAYPSSHSIWPSVVLHGLIALTLLSAARLVGKSRTRQKSY